MRLLAKVAAALGFAYVGFSCFSELRLAVLAKETQEHREVAPVVFDEIVFKNAAQMKFYLAEGYRNQLHVWTTPFETWTMMILLTGTLGALGGTARDVRDSFGLGRTRNQNTELLGLATGIALYAVTSIVPESILRPDISPQVLAALSFVAGVFAENAWGFMRGVARKLFRAERTT